jgi:hypothetical protein
MEHHRPKGPWYAIVSFAQTDPSSVMDLKDDDDVDADGATICANSAAPVYSLDKTERVRSGPHEGVISDID